MTKTSAAGGVSSASAAKVEPDAPASARNNRVLGANIVRMDMVLSPGVTNGTTLRRDPAACRQRTKA
jgi:hypothetical protein